MCRNGEGKTDLHGGGVAFDGSVEKFFQPGKVHDLVIGNGVFSLSNSLPLPGWTYQYIRLRLMQLRASSVL